MVRKCCVPNCTSTKAVPSHTFPKDVVRRDKWFASLNIQPIPEESEIKQLRVCHKHFSEADYSGSGNRRVLIQAAIPFVNLPQPELILLSSNAVEQQTEEETVSSLRNYIVSQHKQTKKVLTEHQILLQQHQDMLQQHKEELERIKNALITAQTSNYTRPDLQEMTRHAQLTPKARQSNRSVVNMKKDRRKLKRLNKKLMTKPINLNLNTKNGSINLQRGRH